MLGAETLLLQANYSHSVLRRAALILSSILFCLTAFTQKHNFISYNIDEGLPQSGVVNILQDTDHHIWAATAGGISRFDGKKFTTYTTDEGLSENRIMQITIDRHQRIWASTNSGLNLISNSTVTVFPFPQKIQGRWIDLVPDKNDKLWCLLNGVIYSFSKNKFVKEDLQGLVNYDLSIFSKDKQENIYVVTHKKELYRSEPKGWRLFASLKDIDSLARIFQVIVDESQNTWVLTSNKIYIKEAASGQLKIYFQSPNEEVPFRCMSFDQSGNLWIGCVKGAFKIKPNGDNIYFNYRNGFSDNWVNHILTDVEGNTWLATEGGGLFKYTGGAFTSFDNTSGYFSSGVFAVSRYDQNSVILGMNGDDFCIYDGKKFTYPLRNTTAHSLKYIYAAYTAPDGVIWIGTLGAGLWKYKNGHAEHVDLPYATVLAICGDGDRIIFSAGRGVVIYEKGEFKKVESINESVRSAIALSDDSLLVATTSQLVLLKDLQIQEQSFPRDFNTSTIAAFEKRNNKVFIGTLGGGIFVWNRQNGNFTKFTRKNGLNSDFIYSLRFDHNGQLWAGTGKGVSRITSTNDFNSAVTIHNYGKEQGFTGLECNQNSITVMDDNTVWFGAVKGAYAYHPEENIETTIEPKLVLQSIKLFSKPLLPGTNSDSVSESAFYPVPENLVLSSRNNHITFEFNAITYRNANVRYSYFLEGLEKEYSVPNQTNFVVYPSLPPGTYTFNVKLADETDKQLGEPIKYRFIIKPAFYQTVWFKILAIVSLLGVAILIYSLRKKYKEKQERLIQKLRTEEQNKIRVKTAQDFHDEMGNKLARITVLSDILKSKLPANEEAQGIAKKIQDNASLLYQGTKDIIWSLNPKNDNLYFLLMHINDFAVDLFHETDIEFESIQVNDEFKKYFLPMDYARNIMMICKEALTNILKHSQANKATIEAGLINEEMIRLVIADNGKGFCPKKVESGNGLHNIRQRADYLNGKLEICSNENSGTHISLTIGIPANEGVRNSNSKTNL